MTLYINSLLAAHILYESSYTRGIQSESIAIFGVRMEFVVPFKIFKIYIGHKYFQLFSSGSTEQWFVKQSP